MTVVIIGCPGAGKNTFARKPRDASGLPLEDCLRGAEGREVVIFRSRAETDEYLKERLLR